MSTSRDRKGQKGKRGQKRPYPDQTGGAETIEIHGVPPTLTPVLIQTLKDSTKFFQKQQSTVLPPEQLAENQSILPTPLSRSDESKSEGVIDGILSRATDSSLVEEQHRRKARMEESTESFFQAIKRIVGDRRSQDQQPHTGFQKSQPSVPVACLLYACELSQSHGRIAVRRAALRVCGILLQKSRECRLHLCEGNDLLDWMKTVVNAPSFSWKNSTHVSSHVLLFQRECFAWITSLCDRFSKHYPKLKVARIFLEQRCPMLDVKLEDDMSTEFGCDNMPQLRLLRDAALEHGTSECQRVQRLVSRAQTCLEVLVPRFDDQKESTVENDEDNNTDDENTDIDWEDGDADEEEHAVAVERTLAVMESTGGFLSGGALEINFDNEGEVTRGDKLDAKSLESLTKIVRRLANRHMPRLNAWVNALTRADSLKASSNDSSSLLLLPVEISQRRAPMLQTLLDVKASVSSVLSSATRLSVEIPSVPEQSPRPESAPRVPQPMPASRTRHFPSQKRGANFSRQRSNRVQIKYRPCGS